MVMSGLAGWAGNIRFAIRGINSRLQTRAGSSCLTARPLL